MHKLGTFIFILLPSLTYVLVFRQTWIGVFTPSIYVYIGVFCVLAFLTYMFLHGAYYIVHTGKKVNASVLSLNRMDAAEFRALFKKKIDDMDASRVCVLKYDMDNVMQYELLAISKLYGIVPEKNTDIYVISHKVGKRTEYEVRTKVDLMRNICLGIPFAVALSGWVFLFVMRGMLI